MPYRDTRIHLKKSGGSGVLPVERQVLHSPSKAYREWSIDSGLADRVRSILEGAVINVGDPAELPRPLAESETDACMR